MLAAVENKKAVRAVKRLMELLTVVLLKRHFLRKVPGLIALERNWI